MAGENQDKLSLTLFVNGNNPRCGDVVERLRETIEKEAGPDADFCVVDIHSDPDALEVHQIMVTPTLIRHFPTPSVRFVGDLSDLTAVESALRAPCRSF